MTSSARGAPTKGFSPEAPEARAEEAAFAQPAPEVIAEEIPPEEPAPQEIQPTETVEVPVEPEPLPEPVLAEVALPLIEEPVPDERVSSAPSAVEDVVDEIVLPLLVVDKPPTLPIDAAGSRVPWGALALGAGGLALALAIFAPQTAGWFRRLTKSHGGKAT